MRPGTWRACFCERREERRVRPAVPERHAEPLRAAVRHVGAHLAGRRQQDSAQQIRADRHRNTRRPLRRDASAQIVHAARLVRRLHERAEYTVVKRGFR